MAPRKAHTVPYCSTDYFRLSDPAPAPLSPDAGWQPLITASPASSSLEIALADEPLDPTLS
ncbi:hypothetical protein H2248_006760 [Termitomyces sp. 'cryptogamus']|nr:hypothetical protein H2248_006760 [Termitomyces sp. 'cryptogamus']